MRKDPEGDRKKGDRLQWVCLLRGRSFAFGLLVLFISIIAEVFLLGRANQILKLVAFLFALTGILATIFVVWKVCVFLTWKIQERLFFMGAKYYDTKKDDSEQREEKTCG